MRRICTFNLADLIVKEMHHQIRKGYRSQFVQDAIQEKIQRVTSHDLSDYKITHLLSHIRNFRFSSLTALEKTLLDGMIQRLEDIGQ